MPDTAFRNFEWSVRAIAQPADVQISLFPDYVWVGDELALDFEEWLEAARRSSEWDLLSSAQVAAIDALDRHLESMSGPEHIELWDDKDTLYHRSEWAEARALALRVLAFMDWTDSPPPRDRATYVGPPESPES